MSDDPGHLALVIAAVNDPTTKERLGLLRAEFENVQVERKAAEDAAARNGEILAEIQRAGQAIEARAVELDARERKLKADTDALTAVINSHNAERSRWEEQRVIVDRNHATRAAELAAATSATEAKTQAVTAREIDLDLREAAIERRETAHHRRHAAIEAALKVA